MYLLYSYNYQCSLISFYFYAIYIHLLKSNISFIVIYYALYNQSVKGYRNPNRIQPYLYKPYLCLQNEQPSLYIVGKLISNLIGGRFSNPYASYEEEYFDQTAAAKDEVALALNTMASIKSTRPKSAHFSNFAQDASKSEKKPLISKLI